MEFVISTYYPGVRPRVALPTHQMFFLLKETGMRKMVSDHYDLLGESEIKDLFPQNPIALEKAKEHSADLAGILSRFVVARSFLIKTAVCRN